jgi:hypothetical protein
MISSSDPALTRSSAQLKKAESLQRLVREQQETIQVLHQTIEKMAHQMQQQQERIEQLEVGSRS